MYIYMYLCKIAKKEKYMHVNMVHFQSTVNYNHGSK